MLAGGYHSGPVHTIRIIGFVGLVVISLAMIRVAFHMHRLIKRSRGTPWFPVVLFLSIPNLILPIQFTLIFGEFHSACSIIFFGFGLTRLMERNLSFAREESKPAETMAPVKRRVGLGATAAAQRV